MRPTAPTSMTLIEFIHLCLKHMSINIIMLSLTRIVPTHIRVCIQTFGTDSGEPKAKVEIVDCGLVD